jgi:hypothetical protein
MTTQPAATPLAILAPAAFRALRGRKEMVTVMYVIYFHVVTLPLAVVFALALRVIRPNLIRLNLNRSNVVGLREADDRDDNDQRRAA